MAPGVAGQPGFGDDFAGERGVIEVLFWPLPQFGSARVDIACVRPLISLGKVAPLATGYPVVPFIN